MNLSVGMELLILATVFLAVVAAVFGLWGLMRRDPSVSERMRDATRAPEVSTSMETLTNKGRMPFFLRLIEPFQRKIAQSDADQVGKTRRNLIEAGFNQSHAVDIFFSVRLILAIGLGVTSSFVLFIFPDIVEGSKSIFAVLGATSLGYYLPVMWLHAQVSARRKAFSEGLPDALDMMLVGVQAGLSLPAALAHVVAEFNDVHPVVAEQFHTVGLEFQAGMGRAEALERMAQRMRVPEARTFATMVAQAESLGTRMSDTLLVIADEMRVTRELRAEQKAAELPVRMSVPLVLLVFPCLFLVIMSPVVISIMRTFGGMGSQ